jgi:hypothetical protein
VDREEQEENERAVERNKLSYSKLAAAYRLDPEARLQVYMYRYMYIYVYIYTCILYIYIYIYIYGEHI